MDNISKHITYAEATKSQEAIRLGMDNTPTAAHLEAMKLVALKCFEPLREMHGKPIGISSFYRSPEVNERIKGSSRSQHIKGEAIDIDADIFNNGITNKQMFEWLRNNVEFDQLIWEYGTDENPDWVHVSCKEINNRKSVLRVKKSSTGSPIYLPI